jgi:hypothetical protein
LRTKAELLPKLDNYSLFNLSNTTSTSFAASLLELTLAIFSKIGLLAPKCRPGPSSCSRNGQDPKTRLQMEFENESAKLATVVE